MKSRLWQDDNKVKIKICGVKNIEFAYDCYDLGVSALGYHLWQPSDGSAVKEEKFLAHAKILSLLPAEITSVLVTTVSDLNQLTLVQEKCQFDTIQLHLEVSEEEITELAACMKGRFGTKIIGVVSMNEEEHTYGFSKLLNYYVEQCDSIILDKGWKGGTGLTYDWDLATPIVNLSKKPVLIAGGINAENIKQANTKIKPYGFDIESGAERKIGKERIKSTIKTLLLLEAVRA